MATPLLEPTPQGLFCPAGGFYIDAWAPVDRTLVTHAHGDHVAWGARWYLTSDATAPLLRRRLGDGPHIETLAYAEPRTLNGVRVSFHPAGHILGSAQIRVEYTGEVWVVSGDYKTVPDPTCAPFEPLRCNTFVTESTFGLPVYRWDPEPDLFADLHRWWRDNQEAGRTSLLLAYSLGKAQRLLAGIDASHGPVLTHGAVEAMTEVYRTAGVALAPTTRVGDAPTSALRNALVIAPPGAERTPWARRLGDAATAMASGWMRVRGMRRRYGVDRGFALSDHADWSGLLEAIDATGADHVLVTHGYSATLARWLSEKGLDARAIATRWEGERDDTSAEELPA